MVQLIISYIFPNFENCARCEKDLKDNKDNGLHLGRKYARIFVLGHYLFLVAHSFPRASLIYEHIFAPNGDYCLYNIQREPLTYAMRISFQNYKGLYQENVLSW